MELTEGGSCLIPRHQHNKRCGWLEMETFPPKVSFAADRVIMINSNRGILSIIDRTPSL